jgi:glycosyltransferase involved in cell wall biosynthesis
MTPFFSILIPVYNKAGTMDECVASVKAQTFGDLEVIFVNDGSTDGSAAEIESFCAGDERFRFLTHEKNSSLIGARSTGMRDAKGSYILFLDSDDLFTPDACESLHDLLAKDPVDIVRFDIIEEPEMRVRAAEEFPEGVMDAFMHGKISPTVWKNCYSRRVTDKAISRFTPFYANMSEDIFLSTVFYSCAESFAVLNRTLYRYQTGSGMSTTHKVTPAKMRRDVDSIMNIEENLYAYTEKYCPEWRGTAEKLIKRAMHYVFINGVWEYDDLVSIMDVIYPLREGRTRWLYEDICREAIPALVRKQFGLSDRKMDLAGVPYERFTWFED